MTIGNLIQYILITIMYLYLPCISYIIQSIAYSSDIFLRSMCNFLVHLDCKKKIQSISQGIPNVKDERTGGKRIEHLLICDTLHLSKVTEEGYNSVHHDSFSLTLSCLWQIVKAKINGEFPGMAWY